MPKTKRRRTKFSAKNVSEEQKLLLENVGLLKGEYRIRLPYISNTNIPTKFAVKRNGEVYSHDIKCDGYMWRKYKRNQNDNYTLEYCNGSFKCVCCGARYSAWSKNKTCCYAKIELCDGFLKCLQCKNICSSPEDVCCYAELEWEMCSGLRYIDQSRKECYTITCNNKHNCVDSEGPAFLSKINYCHIAAVAEWGDEFFGSNLVIDKRKYKANKELSDKYGEWIHARTYTTVRTHYYICKNLICEGTKTITFNPLRRIGSKWGGKLLTEMEIQYTPHTCMSCFRYANVD